jgi:hypothetical protein
MACVALDGLQARVMFDRHRLLQGLAEPGPGSRSSTPRRRLNRADFDMDFTRIRAVAAARFIPWAA